MINAVIIDDEQDAREDLLYLLQKHCPQVKVTGQADSVESGIPVIDRLNPDLLFLDIHMASGTGFDLLSRLSNITFEVIFVTAYDEYAIKAFKFSALDYLLKPVRTEELIHAVTRLETKNRGNASERVKLLSNHSKNNKTFTEIALPSSNGIEIIHVQDIIRCEAQINYTNFILKNGRRIIVARTLKEYEELLTPCNFIRIHKSHLINMNHVKRYIRSDGGAVVMADGAELELSRRKKEAFLEKLNTA